MKRSLVEAVHLGTYPPGEMHLVFGYYRPPCPIHVKCKDGTTFSMQAGADFCCTPRGYDAPYTAFECAYAVAPIPESWGHMPDEEDWPVWGEVSLEAIYEYLELHGGEELQDF